MKHSFSRCIIISLIFVIHAVMISNAQDKDWNGKKSAVCLTYDDALNVHLDNVVPLLDSLGFHATFYISGYFPGFRNRINDWRKAAEEGNELGNHTLFHPCEGNKPGREWVNPVYDLSKYTIERMVDEIRMNNVLLKAVDGRTKRTFAYPCGDMEAGDSSYVPEIKKYFVAARSVEQKMQKLNEIKLFDIGCYMINGENGDQLIEIVKQAMQNNDLLVFLFHGVGGEHNINVSLEAHGKLLHFLKQNEKDIWIAPLVDIGEYIKEHQMN